MLDQEGLLVFEGRFPHQAINLRAHTLANRGYLFRAHSAIVLVDTDTLARLASLHNYPLSAPFQVLQRQFSQLDSRWLLRRVLLTHFANGDESVIEGAADQVAPPVLWQRDGAIRDFHRAKTQHVRMLHKWTATAMHNGDFQKCPAWIRQDAACRELQQLAPQHIRRHKGRGAKGAFPVVDTVTAHLE